MAKVFFITGSLGSGKTLAGLDMVRKYLQEGRKVATNVNLNLEHLCSADNKTSRVIRVPDAPEINHLRAIGFGSDSQADGTHGLLLLDELGTWFNARDFTSKGRLEVIKWMIHMRKRRWDVAFIVQDFSMVDKQARGNIAQFLVTCQNSKTMLLFKMFPKFHVATVRMTATKMVCDRWFYRGSDLYQAYDTEQLFHTGPDDDVVDADAEMSQAEKNSKAKNGLYCVLPSGYFSDTDREAIRERFRRINRNRNVVVAGFVLLIAASAALFTMPGDAIAISEQPAQQAVSEAAPPEPVNIQPVEPPGVQKYLGWRVNSYSYIGGRIVRVDITDGDRIVPLEHLIAQNISVSYPAPRLFRLVDREGQTLLLHFR